MRKNRALIGAVATAGLLAGMAGCTSGSAVGVADASPRAARSLVLPSPWLREALREDGQFSLAGQTPNWEDDRNTATQSPGLAVVPMGRGVTVVRDAQWTIRGRPYDMIRVRSWSVHRHGE